MCDYCAASDYPGNIYLPNEPAANQLCFHLLLKLYIQDTHYYLACEFPFNI